LECVLSVDKLEYECEVPVPPRQCLAGKDLDDFGKNYGRLNIFE